MAKPRRTKKTPRFIGAFLLILICTLSCCACTYTISPEQNAKKIDFLSLEPSALERYIDMGGYKNITVAQQGSASRGEAVWSAILESSEVKEYPEQHVYYYVAQLKAQYEYYAKSAGMSYSDITKELGVTDGTILKEAKELTKRDIICAIVQKNEGISLTDEEKQTHFDRYVDMYVSEYGYSEEYVRANMTDEIYGSMLYDKTTEFLILNNNFN